MKSVAAKSDIDHVHPSSPPAAPVAILYGSPGTPCFAPFHSMLKNSPHVGYALRPTVRTRPETPIAF